MRHREHKIFQPVLVLRLLYKIRIDLARIKDDRQADQTA